MRRRSLLTATAAAVGLATTGTLAPAYAGTPLDERRTSQRPRTPRPREDNVQVPGGSNYNFFDLQNCDREPFGVLKNFHTRKDVVREQLTAMREGGQERLLIGVFHGHGLDTGTLIDSTGGNLPAQQRQNLHDLLALVKELGYAEVEVTFHVLGPNDPNQWESFDEELYQENWQLIQKLRPIVAGAGLHYRLGLGNELTPAPNQPMTLEYTKRLWADYTAAYGRDDTVGFSVIGSVAERIAAIPQMYGDQPPHVFDFHFYGDDKADEYQQFVAAHEQMKGMGLTQGWVVGETYYNDPTAAQNIRRAITDTGRRVYWLTQWPLTRARACDHVDVTPPTAFDAFTENGF